MSVVEIVESVSTDTQAVVERFAAAINALDAAAARACLTDDTVYETPDGTRLEGIEEVAGYWAKFIANSPNGVFTLDGWLASGNTVDVRWTYQYLGPDGATVTLRGLDRLTARDGKLWGKYSYVKR
jgi:ketosteroid isomerase-like protein